MPFPRKIAALACLLLFAGACSTTDTVQEPGYLITKVNRTLIDSMGHETDVVGDLKGEAVYQYWLRRHPEQQFGSRFHIRWKAPEGANVRVQVDARGLTADNKTVFDAVSVFVDHADGWTHWSTLDFSRARLKRLGTIMAWKVTVFSGDKPMAVLPSGNWYEDIKETPLEKSGGSAE